MFSQFFGNYLLETNKITAEQLNSCMDYIKCNRVRMGLLAETEGLLTREQANELNLLQKKSDKRFGDLAIEKGYLTSADIDYLLQQQGNPYLIFIQALQEEKVLSAEEIDDCMTSFQQDKGYSDSIIEAIKQGDIENILPAFVSPEPEGYMSLISLSLRCIIRFVSTYIRFEKGEFVKSHSAHALAYQHTVGDQNSLLGFSCEGDDLLIIARQFSGEDFTQMDEDALDAIAEFTNCINGLYASELSFKDVEIDMEPPLYGLDSSLDFGGQEFYVLPLFIEGKKTQLIIKIG